MSRLCRNSPLFVPIIASIFLVSPLFFNINTSNMAISVSAGMYADSGEIQNF